MSRPRPRGRILAAVGCSRHHGCRWSPATGGARARHAAEHHHPSRKAVKLQILALNDFHGQLEQVTSTSARRGGSTPPRRAARSTSPPTSSSCARRPGPRRGTRVTVAAGDLIGATPAAVGGLPRRAHHRGDEQDGPADHQRRQPRVRRGLARAACGCRRAAASTTAHGKDNQNSCPDQARSRAPTSSYLSANVVPRGHRQDGLPAYQGQEVRRRARSASSA